MYDLPSESPEEPGLPDEFHDYQPQLLSRTLRLAKYPADQVFTGKSIELHYDEGHPLWQKCPDWFLSIGVPRLYKGQDMRSSYVVWQERVSPFVVVELLSPGTEAEDLGPFANISVADEEGKPPRKWVVYEKILQIPYYVVFSRHTRQLRFFKLLDGAYQEQTVVTQNPQIWLAELEIGLGLWEGKFAGIPHTWLRWCDAEGNWLPTDTEVAKQQTKQAEIRLEQAEIQLKIAACNLAKAGMMVEQVAQIMGLSIEQTQKILS
ncbi:MAG: Uma2 family endonuclease [Cyanobacteria bacterium P01_G01_bin.38]